MKDNEQQAPERIWIDDSGKDSSFWNDNGDAIGTIEYVRADLLQQPTSEHRCPHFTPKGEDSGGAYNAQIITDVTHELIDSEDRARMAAKPTSWYSLLIKQLVQRIANLRVMLHEARAQQEVATTGATQRQCRTCTMLIGNANVDQCGWCRAGAGERTRLGQLLCDAAAITVINEPNIGARVEIRFSELRDAQRLHKALVEMRAPATVATEGESQVRDDLTDEEVDRFLQEQEHEPVDQAQLARVRQRFNEKAAMKTYTPPTAGAEEVVARQVGDCVIYGAKDEPVRTRVQPPAAPQDETPVDLIAYKWANTLSAEEQSVLLSSSIKRLSNMIVEARANAVRECSNAVAESLRALKENYIPVNCALEVTAVALENLINGS